MGVFIRPAHFFILVFCLFCIEQMPFSSLGASLFLVSLKKIYSLGASLFLFFCQLLMFGISCSTNRSGFRLAVFSDHN